MSKNKKLKKFYLILISIFCVLLMLTMLIFGDIYSFGIKTGLNLCGNILIPALFPFMIVSAFCSNKKILNILSKPLIFLSKIFKIPKNCCSIYFLSLVGGYIAGPIAIVSAVKDKTITTKTAEKLLCFCVNSGPAYMITFIGAFVFKNILLGFAMLFCQIISSFIIGVIVRNKNINEQTEPNNINHIQTLGESFTKSVTSSSIIMTQMCGFVLIFSAVIYFFENVFGKSFGFGVFSGFLEITNGITYLQQYTYGFSNGGIDILSSTIICCLTAFSGLCVILQITSICKKENINISLFIKARIIYCLISSFLFFVSTKIFPQILICEIPNSINVWIAQNGSSGEFFAHTPLFTVIMICMCVILILTIDLPKLKRKNEHH